MNKKFAAFFAERYGMEISKDLAYGTIKGYEVNAAVHMLDNIAPLRLHVSFYATDEQKRKIENDLRNLALKFFNMTFTPYGLMLGFNDITANRLLKRLGDLLDTIFGIIINGGALSNEYCPVCGNRLDHSTAKKRNIDGVFVTIDDDCANTINSIILAENQDFDNAPNNYLKGFLGALVGGLAGVAVTVILYLLGFVSSLSVIVSMVVGTLLYKKLGGKPNKMMILIVSLTSLVMIAATVPVVYIVAAGMAASEVGVSMSAFEAFAICMDDAEFSRFFYSDLALILLFSALGTAYEIFALSKQIVKRKNNI